MPKQRGKPRVLARDRIRIIADEMAMEEKTVRQVIIRLKTDGLIASGRPIAPEMTPGNLAAILIALAAPLPSRATETLGRIGSLPRAAGFGAETAIEEIAAILLAAARRDRSFDFRWGDVLIGVNQPSVSMRRHLAVNSQVKSATYKDDTHYSGAATFMCIPMDVISRLGRQLIEV